MPTNTVSGSIAVPIGARIGFGVPDTADQEPTGPSILVSDGDPNGTIDAPIGTLALDATTPALWQNTDGATAWAPAGGGSLAVFARSLYVNNGMTVASPDGSIAAPFPTIQAALDAAGPPADILDQFLPYNIIVQTGIYDEDLAVPPYRAVNLLAVGGPVAVQDFSGTVPRDLVVHLTGPPPPQPPGPFNPIENRIGIIGTHPEGLFSFSGSVVLLSDAGGGNIEDVSLNTVYAVVQGRGAGNPGINATGFLGGGEATLTLTDSEIFTDDSGDIGVPVIAGPTGPPGDPLNRVLVWRKGDRVRLESRAASNTVAIQAGSYGQLHLVQFDGDLIFTNDDGPGGGIVDDSSGLPGMFQCGFSNGSTFTGTGFPAGRDFQADGSTARNAAGRLTLTPPATLSLLDSGDAAQNSYTPAIVANWSGVAPTDVADALDRIAALIGPIP
jgi:hypothetical protein